MDRSQLSQTLSPGEVAATCFSGGRCLLGLLGCGAPGEGWGSRRSMRRPGALAKIGRAVLSPTNQGPGRPREMILLCICIKQRSMHLHFSSFIIRRKSFKKIHSRRGFNCRKGKAGLYYPMMCQCSLGKLRHKTPSNEAELSISAL